jgi:hypothetical protein
MRRRYLDYFDSLGRAEPLFDAGSGAGD